jgi:hypothetical protein
MRALLKSYCGFAAVCGVALCAAGCAPVMRISVGRPGTVAMVDGRAVHSLSELENAILSSDAVEIEVSDTEKAASLASIEIREAILESAESIGAKVRWSMPHGVFEK